MKNKPLLFVAMAINLFIVTMALMQCAHDPKGVKENAAPKPRTMLDDGKEIFRYETFGDEVFWTDRLQLHKAIAGSKRLFQCLPISAHTLPCSE